MRKLSILTIIIILLTSCNMSNPLLKASKNDHQSPVFDQIKLEYYKPAIEESIAIAKKEVNEIASNSIDPSFENTIEALEYSGRDFSRVASVFYNLNAANTSPQMQKIAQDVAPMVTEYSMSVVLNTELFGRVKTVYNDRANLSLNKEQSKLLEKTYKMFSRNGANLSPQDKKKYSKIAEQLSILSLKFDENLLAATNDFILTITDTNDLAGLPSYIIDMGATEAKSKNIEGWVYTLHAPSYSPFMQYSQKRELREKMWKAYNTKCLGEEFDNKTIVKQIVDLRIQEATLLGYPTYADYALEERMAKSSKTVNEFLDNLLEKSLPFAKKDLLAIKKYAHGNGFNGEIMPWDFSFYSEKYKDEKYAINDELLKPYFQLENVTTAVFELSRKLFGLKFVKNISIPKYHDDVVVYEVYDESDRFMSLLYMDFFPRESKSGGAWMTSYREQGFYKGVEERPFISVVTNFTKPTQTSPSLLTFYEVTTLLHEFGHALHGILAEGSYPTLTGTNVARDFVELPSQILENWAYEQEFLASFAKHYQTGEKIPNDIIEKIIDAKNYNAGYSSVRQLMFGINDMAWHSTKEVPSESIVDFEKNAVRGCQVLPAIDGVAFSPAFAHIFAGGYAAGYYSYKWAEVLEADAYSLFKEKGIFNKDVADSFRKEILSQGGIEDADILFKNFRGRDPEPDALLIKFGMK